MSRLLIIDGHAIIHRAYYSMPPLTSNGQPVNAIYGFYSMLLAALDTLSPKYLLVCLDSPGPTFRSQEFIGYRAKRKIPDQSLIAQLPLLKSSLVDASIPNLSMGGFEADDLIATATQKLSPKAKLDKVLIVTGDKDLMQLVDNKTHLIMPLRGLSQTQEINPSFVKDKLGVVPGQVVDLKALMGDMSDNYPGVAGIGPKTASDLLVQYHTLDNIYANLGSLKPSLAQKLEAEKDNAYLSQKLATLINNIPLDIRLRNYRITKNQIRGLESIFKFYNFKSLLARLKKIFPKEFYKSNSSNQKSLF
ncbi:MAG: 5'-3' exonuclease [Patescibacteria group bacterium]|jgi:DNA polymerase-1